MEFLFSFLDLRVLVVDAFCQTSHYLRRTFSACLITPVLSLQQIFFQKNVASL